MIYIKRFILLLLLLFPIILVFNIPGLPVLENFPQHLFNYSPLTAMLFKLIFSLFPPQKTVYFFYNQKAWIFYKFILLFVYYMTIFPIVHLVNSLKKRYRIEKIDLALFYFGSVSILLLSVGFSFYDILSAPFFILSISFLFRKKNNRSIIFYILAIGFNLTLSILGPLFFLYIFVNSKSIKKFKILQTIGFLILPAFAFLSNLSYLNILSKYQRVMSDIFGFQWFFERPFLYAADYNINHITVNIGFIATIVISLLSGMILIYLIKKIRIFKLFILFSIMAFLARINIIISVFASLFLAFYSYFLIKCKKNKFISKSTFVKLIFIIYLAYLLFFPSISDGNLIWISMFALLVFLFNNSVTNKILLLVVNLIVFVNLFVFHGTAGDMTVRGDYFLVFQSVFGFLSIIFSVRYISTSFKIDLSNWLKWFLVVLLVAVNLSLIPSDGSPDHVAWRDYSNAVVKVGNSFKAQTISDIDQRYPPLNMAIMGEFALLWKQFIGISKDYAIATKISILSFYVLTIYIVVSLARRRLKIMDSIIISLTTFSMIIQTQGLADVNIYIFPTLLISFFFLIKRRYFYSGILYGVTLSIKWEPVILIPVFFAFILDFHALLKHNKEMLKSLLFFLSGFLLVIVLSWLLVIIYPGGGASAFRSFYYLIHGAPALSGQALNLNWIVTYVMHVVSPGRLQSITELGGLNVRIRSIDAPYIFQGLFFYIASFLIILKFWLYKKKNLISVVTTSMMIFFSHQILNKSAYEKHFFYTVVLMLVLYVLKPNLKNRYFLILFDIMTMINLIFFYGFTGPKDINRLFFGFDMTILFSVVYVAIFLWIIFSYFKDKIFTFEEASSQKDRILS